MTTQTQTKTTPLTEEAKKRQERKNLELKVAAVIGDLKDHGIVLLTGDISDKVFHDPVFLAELDIQFRSAFPKGDAIVEFKNILLDFHGQARRQRQVLAITRQSFLRDSTEISPIVSLQEFCDKQAHGVARDELKRFMAHQTNLLITESEGEENIDLYSILSEQTDIRNRPLLILAIPVINFFSNKEPRMAFVYVTKGSSGVAVSS